MHFPFHTSVWSLANNSARNSSQISSSSPPILLSTVFSLSLKLTNHPLDYLNLFPSFLPFILYAPVPQYRILESFWLSHSQTTPTHFYFCILFSFPLVFLFTLPLLFSSHLSLFPTCLLLCHKLRVSPTLNFSTICFTVNLSFSIALLTFTLSLRSSTTLLWAPWIQLNEEVKNLWYFTINGLAVISYLCNPSASKCNSDFRFGTWQYLRNTTLCAMK